MNIRQTTKRTEQWCVASTILTIVTLALDYVSPLFAAPFAIAGLVSWGVSLYGIMKIHIYEDLKR